MPSDMETFGRWQRMLVESVQEGALDIWHARKMVRDVAAQGIDGVSVTGFDALYAEASHSVFEPIDWLAMVDLLMLANDDIHESWLVDDVWPSGRQVHVHAKAKSGKSLLSLWVAACLAIGRDPFTGKPREPITVGYYDWEMTLLDLKTRLFDDMGFKPQLLIPNLHYYLHPTLPFLDTASGGDALLANVRGRMEQAVFIDTMSRVVQGGENDNDTYINFYKHTGQKLKAEGVALWRNDHEGNVEGRSRGASAKADDVDIVWQMKRTDSGMNLVRQHTRLADVPETVTLFLDDSDGLEFKREASMVSWPEGTAAKAAELDALNAPLDISVRNARALLKQNNMVPGRTTVLTAALAYRRQNTFGVP